MSKERKKTHGWGKPRPPPPERPPPPLPPPPQHTCNEPPDGRSGRCSWHMARICRLNNSADIDQYVSLAILGKSVAMHSHTRCHGQFSFHARGQQCDRVIACFCCFIFMTKGVR